MKIAPHSKLLMIGDSITDCGRRHPVGEGRDNALGHGYVALVQGILGAFAPSSQIRVINMGRSGDTIRQLKERWKSDVIDLEPDWLSVMIGINDVWRQFDSPHIRESHVSLEEFEATYDELLSHIAPRLKGLVLLSPFYLEPNLLEPMRVKVDTYGGLVFKLARKYRATFVDCQAAFEATMRLHHPCAVAWDHVHPNLVGHMIIARAFLECVGFEWPPAKPTRQ